MGCILADDCWIAIPDDPTHAEHYAQVRGLRQAA